MFSEVTEVRDAIHLLTPRAVNEEVGKRLLEEMEWYDNYLNMGKTDRSANPSPGNKKGGLANVVEKALGSIAKSGKSAIVEVLSPGQRPTKRGLIYAATPASDFVCGTQQVASGLPGRKCLATGRGTPYGLMAVPVIKMATRTELANRWFDLMILMRAPSLPAKKLLKRWAGSCSTLFSTSPAGRRNLLRSMGTA